MQFRLWTEIWEIVFVRSIPHKTHDVLGWFDREKKEIKVLRTLKGPQRLDTLIHEMLHAVLPEKEELWINSVATDMTNVLLESGYRNVDEKSSN